ncbi:MAG: hypothetical protein J6C67_03610 [Muribaculaceae bacterium]|nr:hypothetical protein [Muribaculaceae bacterium]
MAENNQNPPVPPVPPTPQAPQNPQMPQNPPTPQAPGNFAPQQPAPNFGYPMNGAPGAPVPPAPKGGTPADFVKNHPLLIGGIAAGAVVFLFAFAAVIYFVFFSSNIKEYDRIPSAINTYYDYDASKSHNASAEEYARVHGHENPLQISLMWNGTNDYDLIVHQPNGTELYFGNPTDRETYAHFSGDAMGDAPSGEFNIETVEIENPMNGDYDVFVRARGLHSDYESRLMVVVIENGRARTYEARLKANKEGINDFLIADFDCDDFNYDPAYVPRNAWEGPESFSSGDRVSEYWTLTGTSTVSDNAAVQKAMSLSGSDQLKIALLWNGTPDLDLYVNAPNSKDIYYGHREDRNSTGRHSGDDVGGGESSECVSFAAPLNGIYDVFVRVGTSAIDQSFKVVVLNNGASQVYECTVPAFDGSQRFVKVTQLDVNYDTVTDAPRTRAGSGTYYSPGYAISRYTEANVSTTASPYHQMRAEGVNGGNGLRITLFWDNSVDLDLIVNGASGSDVYYGNRNAGGGHHGGDNMGSGLGNFETVYFNNPSSGLYDVFVRARGEAEVTVVIEDRGNFRCYTGTLVPSGNSDFRIASFNR